MREVIQEIHDEYEISGSTMTIHAGDVVRAVPRNGNPEYLRLQFSTGETYLWTAPVSDWNEQVTEDDPRWEREN